MTIDDLWQIVQALRDRVEKLEEALSSLPELPELPETRPQVVGVCGVENNHSTQCNALAVASDGRFWRWTSRGWEECHRIPLDSDLGTEQEED